VAGSGAICVGAYHSAGATNSARGSAHFDTLEPPSSGPHPEFRKLRRPKALRRNPWRSVDTFVRTKATSRPLVEGPRIPPWRCTVPLERDPGFDYTIHSRQLSDERLLESLRTFAATHPDHTRKPGSRPPLRRLAPPPLFRRDHRQALPRLVSRAQSRRAARSHAARSRNSHRQSAHCLASKGERSHDRRLTRPRLHPPRTLPPALGHAPQRLHTAHPLRARRDHRRRAASLRARLVARAIAVAARCSTGTFSLPAKPHLAPE
jgi:hypothetical protein